MKWQRVRKSPGEQDGEDEERFYNISVEATLHVSSSLDEEEIRTSKSRSTQECAG